MIIFTGEKCVVFCLKAPELKKKKPEFKKRQKNEVYNSESLYNIKLNILQKYLQF